MLTHDTASSSILSSMKMKVDTARDGLALDLVAILRHYDGSRANCLFIMRHCRPQINCPVESFIAKAERPHVLV